MKQNHIIIDDRKDSAEKGTKETAQPHTVAKNEHKGIKNSHGCNIQKNKGGLHSGKFLQNGQCAEFQHGIGAKNGVMERLKLGISL